MTAPAQNAWATPPPNQTTGAWLVLLEPEAVSEGLAALGMVAGPEAPTEVFTNLGVAVVRTPPERGEGLAAAAADPSVPVAAAEPDRVIYALGSPPAPGTAVRDTGAATWGLRATRASGSQSSGRGVSVAVLDSGLDLTHPDFAGRAIIHRSFVEGLSVQDGHGHGTHCAGTASGPHKPGQGPRYGVAYAADLHVGRVLDDYARGSDRSFLAALEWAVAAGCRVVSASVGQQVAPGTPYSRVMEQAARRAMRAGTLIVGSAGNDSNRPDDVQPVSHPANCPSILAVAAVASDMAIGAFSNGADAGDARVDIAAPGVDVYSSYPMPFRYRRLNGTSMATPHVAGVAALLLEEHPELEAQELRTMLLEQAQTLPSPAAAVGSGLVQAP